MATGTARVSVLDFQATGTHDGTYTRVLASAAGSRDVTIQHARDYAEGQWVILIGCGAPHSLRTPARPIVETYPAALDGDLLREYTIVYLTHDFGWSAASPAQQMANTPKVFTPRQRLRVYAAEPDAPTGSLRGWLPDGVRMVVVYARQETAPGSAALGDWEPWQIAGGYANHKSAQVPKQFTEWMWHRADVLPTRPFRPGSSHTFTLPNEPPRVPTPNALRTRITAITGGTRVTLDDAVISASTRLRFDHDESIPFARALDAGDDIEIPGQQFRLWGDVKLACRKTLRGHGDRESRGHAASSTRRWSLPAAITCTSRTMGGTVSSAASWRAS